MSCILLCDQHYKAIIDCINRLPVARDCFNSVYTNQADITEIVLKWRADNYDAFNGKYAANHGHVLKLPYAPDHKVFYEVSMVALYGMLKCTHYQNAEVPIYERETYKKLTDFIATIADAIISELDGHEWYPVAR